jgi:hypothetical protein
MDKGEVDDSIPSPPPQRPSELLDPVGVEAERRAAIRAAMHKRMDALLFCGSSDAAPTGTKTSNLADEDFEIISSQILDARDDYDDRLLGRNRCCPIS